MHYLRNKLSVFAAYLLLVIFSMIQVTEVVHNHVDDHHLSVMVGLKKQAAEISIANAVLKCKFCKDLSNQQIGMQPLDIATFDFAVHSPSTSIKAAYTQKLFKSAVNTWTNKGPPIA